MIGLLPLKELMEPQEVLRVVNIQWVALVTALHDSSFKVAEDTWNLANESRGNVMTVLVCSQDFTIKTLRSVSSCLVFSAGNIKYIYKIRPNLEVDLENLLICLEMPSAKLVFLGTCILIAKSS